MKKICIYHANCADGFGAATAVYMRQPSCEFYPAMHGSQPPNVTDAQVVMVDYAYPREVIINMARKAHSILIIDHHKSAALELIDLPRNVKTIFNMKKSGAVMAWEFFHSQRPVPQLLIHIQDHDLHQFTLDNTPHIMASLFSYSYDFKLWKTLINSNPENLVTEGRPIRRRMLNDTNEIIANAAYKTNIAGHIVPVVNVPYFYTDDAAHIMGKNSPFAACYWDTKDTRHFGLRSAPNGLDVSLIAKKFGGGGHKHSAGFRIALSKLNTLGDEQ